MKVDNKIKSSDKLFSKITNFFCNTVNLLCISAVLILVITILAMINGVTSLFLSSNNSPGYIHTEGTIYKEIDGGYVVNELVLESGSELPSAKDYFNEEYQLANDVKISYFDMKNEELDVDDFTVKVNNTYFVKGIHDIFVTIFNDNQEYSASVSILDTTTPEVTVREYTINQGDSYSPKDFIVTYLDNSSIEEYTAEFVDDEEYEEIGDYPVTINVCDTSSNCIDVETKLIIVEKEPEVIESPSNDTPASSSSSTSQVVSQKKPNSGTTSKPSSNNSGNSGNSSSNGNSGSGNSGNSGNTGGNSSGGNSGSGSTGNNNSNSNNNNNINNQKSTDPEFWALIAKAQAYYDNPSNAQEIEYVEDTFITKTNASRASAGVPSLALDRELCLLAQARIREYESLNWSEAEQYIHRRPDGRDFSTIFKDYGYVAGVTSDKQRHYGENYVSVLGGPNYSNDGAFRLLDNSPGHHANIVSKNYTKMGIAKGIDPKTKRIFWIQLFSS